jgi:PBSX family phage terminase large subunit
MPPKPKGVIQHKTKVTKLKGGGVELRIQDAFLPNSKQAEFFVACADAYADEILYDGSIRAGKTQACCKQLIAWAWQYGGRYVVARKTYPELRDSTMAVMLRGEGGMPPGCPPELIKEFRAGDRELHLKNGAEILFRNLESAEEGRAKLRNISLNGFFIDQVEELDGPEWGEFYEELLGRLSDPRGPGKMIMAANPGPTDHWVWRRFIDPEMRDRFPQTRYIHCTLYDNQENLDPKYFQSRIRTEKQNPEYYKRMVLGEWGAFGGKRFKCWDQSKHVIDPFTIPPSWEVIEAVDYGYAHPFVCLWVAIDPQDRYYVIGEHYERERAISHHARCILDARESLNVQPEVMWADPSIFEERGGTSSISMEMNDYTLYPAPANRDRIGGWNRLEEMLMREIDGKPQLQVFATCKNTIKEIPNLRFKENSDDVQKTNDHAADALRYAVMSRPPVPIEEAPGPDFDRRTLYAMRLKERMIERDLNNFQPAEGVSYG